MRHILHVINLLISNLMASYVESCLQDTVSSSLCQNLQSSCLLDTADGKVARTHCMDTCGWCNATDYETLEQFQTPRNGDTLVYRLGFAAPCGLQHNTVQYGHIYQDLLKSAFDDVFPVGEGYVRVEYTYMEGCPVSEGEDVCNLQLQNAVKLISDHQVHGVFHLAACPETEPELLSLYDSARLLQFTTQPLPSPPAFLQPSDVDFTPSSPFRWSVASANDFPVLRAALQFNVSVGIIYADTEELAAVAQGFRSHFTLALRMEVSYFESYPVTTGASGVLEARTDDVDQALLQMQAAGVGIAVFVSANEVSLILRRTAHLAVYFQLTYVSHALKLATSEELDLVFMTGHWSQIPGAPAGYGSFWSNQDYENYGQVPVETIAERATVVLVLRHAMQHSGSFYIDRMVESLRDMDVESAWGGLKFSEYQNIIGHDSVVTQFQRGVAQVVSPESAATAPPILPTPSWDCRRAFAGDLTQTTSCQDESYMFLEFCLQSYPGLRLVYNITTCFPPVNVLEKKSSTYTLWVVVRLVAGSVFLVLAVILLLWVTSGRSVATLKDTVARISHFSSVGLWIPLSDVDPVVDTSGDAQVVGMGTFGVVVAATFRGTKVAVKCAVPNNHKALLTKVLSDDVRKHPSQRISNSFSTPRVTKRPMNLPRMSYPNTNFLKLFTKLSSIMDSEAGTALSDSCPQSLIEVTAKKSMSEIIPPRDLLSEVNTRSLRSRSYEVPRSAHSDYSPTSPRHFPQRVSEPSLVVSAAQASVDAENITATETLFTEIIHEGHANSFASGPDGFSTFNNVYESKDDNSFVASRLLTGESMTIVSPGNDGEPEGGEICVVVGNTESIGVSELTGSTAETDDIMRVKIEDVDTPPSNARNAFVSRKSTSSRKMSLTWMYLRKSHRSRADSKTSQQLEPVEEQFGVFDPDLQSDNVPAAQSNAPQLGNESLLLNSRSLTASHHQVEGAAEFEKEIQKLMKLRHPNIVTVLGACIDAARGCCMVMEFMECGSLYDVLHNQTAPLDQMTSVRLLSQVAAGLQYLHEASPPIIHGDVKALNILLGENFVAKVADFGMSIKAKFRGGHGSPFWMAPESMSFSQRVYNKSLLSPASDVYSFGITMWEVFTREEPYQDILGDQSPLDILSSIQNDSLRPDMNHDSIPSDIKQLIERCLDSDPKLRPKIFEVKVELEDLAAAIKREEGEHSKNKYRGRKESVDSRMELLNQIMPAHVIQALSRGQKVEPEAFEIVTIFFSDIIGYTDLSASLAPEKVMSMLDRLYTQLDMRCREAAIFKVETIGDAYMCVGGIPSKQAEHTVRVALFALNAVRAANSTQIDEEDPKLGCINIRVGFHSGPVVASVVGELNPRYCLFGDTVNTASRMESNSVKNQINMSPQTTKCLQEQAPGIHVESRGIITIKGKGNMECFFLVQSEENMQLLQNSLTKSKRKDVLKNRSSASF